MAAKPLAIPQPGLERGAVKASIIKDLRSPRRPFAILLGPLVLEIAPLFRGN